jgi:hypothetical protein
MARLLRRLGVHISWREILKRTLYETFWKDNCLSMAAQLAYYFFFALFPTLLFLVALASYFPVTSLIDDMFGPLADSCRRRALQIITDQIVKISNQKNGGTPEPWHAARRVELVGGDDGDHRYAESCLRHRGKPAMVEGAGDGGPSLTYGRVRLHPGLVRR